MDWLHCRGTAHRRGLATSTAFAGKPPTTADNIPKGTSMSPTATPPAGAGPPMEMAEAAAQWARHAAWSSSRAAQAASYAAEQAQVATTSAQNAVAQSVYLMNHPTLKEQAIPLALIAALFVPSASP